MIGSMKKASVITEDRQILKDAIIKTFDDLLNVYIYDDEPYLDVCDDMDRVSVSLINADRLDLDDLLDDAFLDEFYSNMEILKNKKETSNE